jgi:hypothetical protein
MMRAMGRPRTGKRSATAHTTLSEDERAGFDRLVAAVNAELQVEMTDAAVLRMLINRAVKDRGLDAPRKNSAPSLPPVPEPARSQGRGGAPAKPRPRSDAIPSGPGSRGSAVAGASGRKKVGAGTKRGKETKGGS